MHGVADNDDHYRAIERQSLQVAPARTELSGALLFYTLSLSSQNHERSVASDSSNQRSNEIGFDVRRKLRI